MTRNSFRAAAVAFAQAFALLAACQRGPGAEDRLRAGRALLGSGHAERALVSFRAAAAETESRPSELWAEATLGAAEALLLLHRVSEAHRLLDDLERLVPPSAEIDRRIGALRAKAADPPERLAPEEDIIDEETIPLGEMMERAFDFPEDLREAPRRER